MPDEAKVTESTVTEPVETKPVEPPLTENQKFIKTLSEKIGEIVRAYEFESNIPVNSPYWDLCNQFRAANQEEQRRVRANAGRKEGKEAR